MNITSSPLVWVWPYPICSQPQEPAIFRATRLASSRSAIENGVLGVAKDFVSIRYSNIHRLSKTAVRFTLVLDDQTANIQDELTEVGLFMNNPQGLVPAAPILVAYRPFAGIKKTDAFSLVFLWTIQF
jgi:hypothetical protein